MNPLRIIAATTLILGLGGLAHAQSDQGPDASGGIQSTLGELAADASEDVGALYQQAVNGFWLNNSDIRMTMKAHDEGSGQIGADGSVSPLELFGPFVITEEASDSSLYAKFDRQNMAMSMRARDSGGQSSIGLPMTGLSLDTSSEATDVTMYFDAAGNVYVPTDASGTGGYVRANLGDVIGGMLGTFQFGIQAAMESGAAEMLDYLGGIAGVNYGNTEVAGLFPEGTQGLLSEYADYASWNDETQSYEVDSDGLGPLQQQLLELYLELAQIRYDELVRFPLVNFAFVFSPTLARSYGNTREESVTWDGLPGATKFTVTSGSDAGYVIIFDWFDRLVLLKDTDGSTAEYMYDVDVTVP